MKTQFFREWNTEFSHARLHSIIGPVQCRIPLYAPILHFMQRFRQWVANSEATAAISHAVREENVLQVALR